MVPDAIGRYRVLSVLGSGAMGEVVRARDERLGRDVAIKRMRPLPGVVAATFRTRFEAEARALAALAHPGVVQVFDLGVDDDQPYLVMELIDGPTLRAVIAERGALPPFEVRVLGIQLARALEAAHARGILHRDIKPGNVLLASGGVWKLADFGVARVPDSSVTLSGQFLGTPAYAAPEALALGQFSPASDVFGLAATLYEAATGNKPRGDATLSELITRADQPLIDAEADVPGELAPILSAALAIDPKARPGAGELARRLAETTPAGDDVAAAPPPPPTADVIAPPPAAAAVVTAGAGPVLAGTPAATVALDADLDPLERARRRRRLTIAAAAIAAAVLIAIIAAATSGGSSDRRTSPTASPRHPGPPAWAGEPERLSFDAPPGLDGKAARDWSKVADKVHEGRHHDALHKLVDFERKHGASPESARLRAWLENLTDDDREWRD